MKKLPTISLGTIMAGLVVVALDCAVYRSIHDRPECLANDLSLVVRSILPMANFLALVGASLIRGPLRLRPGRFGFLVGASLAIVATIFELRRGLDWVESGLSAAGLVAWFEASEIRQLVAIYTMLVVFPLLFQALAGLVGGMIGRKIGGRGSVAWVDVLPSSRLRLASVVALLILAAIPAVVVEAIMRSQVDAKIARLSVGAEAFVDLDNPVALAILFPKTSPILQLGGVKVRVDSDRMSPVIELVADSAPNSKTYHIRDWRVIKVTMLDGKRAGETTVLPKYLLTPVQ